ncbi:MAG: hypothetical protein WC789_00130 [Lentisphaeria bacterium]|jgi:glycine cleavage system H protein
MIEEHPKDLKYTQHHVWVKTEPRKRIARIGVTPELADKLTEILGLDMPMEGDELEMDAPCLHIHRPTSIYEMLSPLSGRVTAVNRDVMDSPNLIALGPYKHWLFCMEYDEDDELDMLFNAQQYTTYLDSL